MTPAHPQPTPCILANPQYQASNPVPSCVTLIKLTAQGQLQWIAQRTDQSNLFDGSDIAETPNGSIYVSGDLIPHPDPTSGPRPYIIKFNSAGQFIWCRSSPSYNYSSSRLTTNSDTTLFLAINGDSVFSIIKLDSAGNTINCKQYRDFAGTYVNLNDWIIDSTGYIKTILLTNNYSQGVTLCTLNQQGNSISAMYAEKSGSTLESIQLLTADTGYIALLKSNGGSKIIVTDWSDGSASPNGIRVGITNPFYPNSFARKSDGSLFIYGSLNATTDLHLLKTDIATTGILPLSGCSTDTTLLSVTPIVIIDSVSNFSFIPYNLVPHLSYLTDSFLVLSQSTDCMLTGINTHNNQMDEISIFPNPTNDFVTIQLDNSKEKSLRIKIVNALGQTIIEKNEFNISEKRIDLSDLNDGIYLIVVSVGEKEFSRKVVVQR